MQERVSSVFRSNNAIETTVDFATKVNVVRSASVIALVGFGAILVLVEAKMMSSRRTLGLMLRGVRSAGSLSPEKLKLIQEGPGLGDFVRNSVASGCVASAEQEVEPEKLTSEPLVRKKGERLPLPKWLRTDIPVGAKYAEKRNSLRKLKLTTVCEEARCPNISECWGGKEGTSTATIMVNEPAS